MEDINKIKEKAERGDEDAQYTLGLCYYKGEGVSQSYEKMVYWFRKAAKQGLVSAQHNLGIFYDIGKGVEQDYESAKIS